MEYQFCRFTDEEENGITEMLNLSFLVSHPQAIKKIYEIFTQDFDSERAPTKMETLQREHLLPRTTDLDFLGKFKDTGFQAGVDLPILLSPKHKSKKTIFIVAEDPLRPLKDKCDKIVFSTPFATHVDCFRKKKLKVYWDITRRLLDNGYNVYITDLLKLWIKQKGVRKEKIANDLFDNFRQSLRKEIELFKPELIVTYGCAAWKLLQEIENSGISKIPFTHPTNTANRKWKSIFIEGGNDQLKCTAENKVNYIISELEKSIGPLPIQNPMG